MTSRHTIESKHTRFKGLPKRVLAGALAVAFATIPMTANADHSWGNYHWARTANPFTLKVGKNVTGSAWNAAFSLAISDWSDPRTVDLKDVPAGVTVVPDVLNLVPVAGGAGNPKRCSASNGRVEVCNAAYGNNGWLGLAQIWASGTHITRGAVKLNDTYFNTAYYNTPAWRNLVTCQEIGHTLGLDHQDETFGNTNLNSCMDYTNSPDSNQHPNFHDYEELGIIYSHADSTTTVDTSLSVSKMPREMIEGEHGDRASWGTLVRSRNNGMREVFVRDFGGGYKLVTFVFWAAGGNRGWR